MDNKASKKKLFQKYLRGQCSPQEQREVWQLLKEADTDLTLHELMEEDALARQAGKALLNPAISEELRSRIQDRIRESRSGAPVLPIRPLSGRISQPWLKVAAGLALLLVLGGLLYQWQAKMRPVTYATAFGERREIVLPDQSVVTLNGNSRLSYAGPWDDSSPREVHLEGEAFFSVVHTQNHQPFLVKTNDQLQVEVLGTAFNVHSRRGNTQVVLKSGIVQLRLDPLHKDSAVVMKPGELVEYGPGKEKLSRKNVNPEAYSAWRNNRLIFQDTPLTDISQLLQDNYGFEVIIADSAVAAEEFTAVYPADNIQVLVKALEKAFDIQVSPNRNRIVIGQENPL